MSFTILLITILPLTYLLTSSIASASDARERQAALQLADSWLEVLSNTSLPTWEVRRSQTDPRIRPR